ncbi:DUF3168 domain-containing protein [Brucella sp. 10RB9214]|nr:DUF3168 domain-containing protein [Brucella sp. 10RB9214]
MKTGAAALQKALFEALKNDGELIETLGGERVYDHVPARTPFPYVTLGETMCRNWSTASEEGGVAGFARIVSSLLTVTFGTPEKDSAPNP